jgi:cytochrome c biogenesis protein CcdA
VQLPKNFRSGVDSIALSLLYKGLAMGTVLVGLLLTGAAAYLGEKWDSIFVSGVGMTVLLGSFFIAGFTWREAVIRMQEDPALSLMDALARTLRGYAFYLSFVPIIGGYFTRFVDPSPEKNPFVTDADRLGRG